MSSSSGLAQETGEKVILTTKDGDIVIKLRPDLAPLHVERIKVLANDEFYDGVPFHRVIDGFMAQGGDPTGTGKGGSQLPDLPAEFSKESFKRGTVAMARKGHDVNSGNSQFFICFTPAAHLDGQYTIWGEVIEGMDLVDRIKKGDARSGAVDSPDKIVKMRVIGSGASKAPQADMPEKKATELPSTDGS